MSFVRLRAAPCGTGPGFRASGRPRPPPARGLRPRVRRGNVDGPAMGASRPAVVDRAPPGRPAFSPVARDRPPMTSDIPSPTEAPSPLDRARVKAYRRLLPILFACYVIAYVDRTNVGLAKLHMMGDLNARAESATPLFNEEAFGFGAGTCFFVGYLLLEIPGTLLVEKWSARKWICRIMLTWGIVASLTALVKVPWHFYGDPLPARRGRGGVLPGRDRLPDPLVPQPRPRAGALVVPDRHADRAVHQPEAVVLPAPDRHGRDDRRRSSSTTPWCSASGGGSGSTSGGACRRSCSGSSSCSS